MTSTWTGSRIPPALVSLDSNDWQRPAKTRFADFGVRCGTLALFNCSYPAFIIFSRPFTSEELAAHLQKYSQIGDERYRDYWHVFDSREGRSYVCEADAHMIHVLCRLNTPPDME